MYQKNEYIVDVTAIHLARHAFNSPFVAPRAVLVISKHFLVRRRYLERNNENLLETKQAFLSSIRIISKT